MALNKDGGKTLSSFPGYKGEGHAKAELEEACYPAGDGRDVCITVWILVWKTQMMTIKFWSFRVEVVVKWE